MDIVILAGGRGSRFFANGTKIIVNFWGIRVIDLLCLNALKISSNVYVVLRKEQDVKLIAGVQRVDHKDAYGTGAAVQSYIESGNKDKDVLIIPGDAPLIDADVLKSFKFEDDSDILLGIMKMPVGKERYGRVFIENKKIVKILEYKEHPEKTEYANAGVILLKKNVLHLLEALKIAVSGEIYLTEIIELAIKSGYIVRSIVLNEDEALGFNTIEEFNSVLMIAQKKWRNKALKSNAIFYDINSIYLSWDTTFEQGAVIEPFVRFLPNVRVLSNAYIKSFSSLGDCIVDGDVGPFAYIRSGKIEENAAIGSFVEFNRSIIKKGSKAKHLSYLGDVVIGENVNIGAGCVICNYDGKNKHKTNIGDHSFIGSNTTLIAPINIGQNAFLAAGSTFTEDVEENKLVIARSRQVVKDKKNK